MIQLRKASRAAMETLQSIATTRLCADLKSQADGTPLTEVPTLKEVCDDLEMLSSQVTKPSAPNAPAPRAGDGNPALLFGGRMPVGGCAGTCLGCFQGFASHGCCCLLWRHLFPIPPPTRHSLNPEPYKLNPKPFASLQVVEEVLEKHASMTPLLRTVEEMVCGTATGRAPACAKFFAHWEAGLHQALHDMILQVPHLLLALLVHVITAAPDPFHWQAGLHHAASFLLSLQHGMVAVHLLQAPTPAISWCCARQQSAGPLGAASTLF